MKPLPFIAIPGFLFSLVGILLMAFFSLNGNVESSHLHTFILGAILVMGGIQVVLSGFLMKTYSVIHGYEKKQGFIELLMKYHNLEIFLVLGFLSILCRNTSRSQYLPPLGLNEFRISFRNLHRNFFARIDRQRNTDISLRRVPEYDAPQ